MTIDEAKRKLMKVRNLYWCAKVGTFDDRNRHADAAEHYYSLAEKYAPIVAGLELQSDDHGRQRYRRIRT